MYRLMGLLFVSLMSLPLMADDLMPLDKINFTMTKREWVKTDKALLVVRVNATLTDADLAKARQNILASLQRIAKGDWHLTRFVRSQDSSGLEKLDVLAQARIPQSDLNNIYQQAKSVSKPGINYAVANIDFKPDLLDMQQAEIALRQALYNDVQAEIARINQVFNQQHYSLANLIFMRGDAPSLPRQAESMEMNVMMLKAKAPAPSLAVSEELIMSASVEAASVRNPEPQKHAS